MTPGLRTPRGLVRLLNTSGGAVLCLAGAVDSAAVADFVRRYGREPARVSAIDAGSVTALSPSGLEILLDHVEVAERTGRPAALRLSPVVGRALAEVLGAALDAPAASGGPAPAPGR